MNKPEQINLKLGGKQQAILVNHGWNYEQLVQHLGNQKCAIISDTNVYQAHQAIIDKLAKNHKATLTVVPAGEESKSLQFFENTISELLQLGHDRSSVVVAFGGGIVCDLAGFVAATFMRGGTTNQHPDLSPRAS